MTRYQKFKKAEKAKTTLKGAKLPKGLNVTKTDFKIKKIVIREQIRDTTVIEDGAVIRTSNIKVCVIDLTTNDMPMVTEFKHFIWSGIVVKAATSQCDEPQRRSALFERAGHQSPARGKQTSGRHHTRHITVVSGRGERYTSRMLQSIEHGAGFTEHLDHHTVFQYDIIVFAMCDDAHSHSDPGGFTVHAGLFVVVHAGTGGG